MARILISWYTNLAVQVKWDTCFSDPFTVTKGLRQGGVPSPYLSAAYLDELSVELVKARPGCTAENIRLI